MSPISNTMKEGGENPEPTQVAPEEKVGAVVDAEKEKRLQKIIDGESTNF